MDTAVFHYWQPSEPVTVTTGPEQRPVPVPDLPVPLRHPVEGRPGDHDIGEGVYAWLRQNPDHHHAPVWARFLADAYPHYLADLAAQAVMLNAKTVDAPYLRRMVTCLKILALIEPDRGDLQAQVGRALIDLAFQFAELPNSRHLLLEALGRLNRALALGETSAATCDALARVNFLMGDYPKARRLWQQAIEALDDAGQIRRLRSQIDRLDAWDVPAYPLLDDFETLGQAMLCWGEKDYSGALDRLKLVERRGELLKNEPLPVYHYLCGMCHMGLGDTAKAVASFRAALEIDARFSPAATQLEKLGEKPDGGASFD